jgi:hypothetical protein
MSDAVLHAAPEHSASRTAWAMPLIPVAVSGFLLSAMTSLRVQGDLPSPPEGTLAGGVVALYRLFGFEPLFMVCVLTLTWSSIWFLTGRVERPLSRLARIGALGLSLAILVNLRIDGVHPSGAGELGALLASRLASVISPAISIFAVAVAAVAALLLATDFFFYGHFERLGARRLAARDAGRSEPEPEVDVAEQSELESLALGVATDAGGPAVDVAQEALAASEDRSASSQDASDPDGDPEDDPVDEAAEASFEPGREDLDGDVWAIEEEISAVTLLGPRVSVESPTAGGAEDDVATVSVERSDAPAVEDDRAAAPDSGSAEQELAESAEDPRVAPESLLTDAAPHARDHVIGFQDAEGGESDPSEAGDSIELVSALETSFAAEAVPAADPLGIDDPRADAGELEDGLAADDVPDATVADAEESVEDVTGDTAADAGDMSVDEPVVELIPAPRLAPVAPATPVPGVDPELVEEAVELVSAYRRASATFFRRRLRIEEDDAIALLQELAARGIIECEAGATQGRVRG